MKLEVHREENVAYLSLEDEIKAGSVHRTEIVNNETMMLDFDESGRLLGIEFIDAARQLGPLFERASEKPKDAPSDPYMWESGT